MYRVGVIGAKQAVQRILEASVNHGDLMELIPYPFEHPDDIRKVLQEEKHAVDTWLFSGPIPYLVAREVLGTDENLMCIPVPDAVLFRAMVDIVYELGRIVDRISVDTPGNLYPVDRVMKQLKRPPRDVFVKPFDPQDSLEELVEYHHGLWRQGKTEAALTFIPAVCSRLRQLGVPAGGLTLGYLEVEQALRMLSERLRAEFFKDRQTGIVLLEIRRDGQLAQHSRASYAPQQLELRVKETMDHLCAQLGGSLSEKGNGRYVIFSSRGAIYRELKRIHQTAGGISREFISPVSVGVGFGETVLSAERNAMNALRLAKGKPGAITIVLDNGMVIESTGGEKVFSYSARMDDQALLEKLKRGSISGKTYNRIYALVRSMGWREFTSKDLSTHLRMSDRNAQRIVSHLCQVGLAEIVGEELNHARGRPSKLYRLLDANRAVSAN